VPVVLGLASHARGTAPGFRMPAALVLGIGALTQVIYPYLYGWLLGLHPGMLVALTLRNALLVVLFVLAVALMLRAARFSAPLASATAHSTRATVEADEPFPRTE